MAARLDGVEYTLTSSVVTLTAALGLSERMFFSHAAFRAGSANGASVFLGKSNVTTAANRLAFLAAGEAFEFALEGVYISSDEIYIAGTAGDKLHIILVI